MHPVTIRIRRPIAAWAVAAAALQLSACGGQGPGGTPAEPDPAPGPVGQLVPITEAALVAQWREQLRAGRFAGPASGALTLTALGADGAPTSAGGAAAPTTGASVTLVQEAGVDEHDVVRVDDGTVWALTPPGTDGVQRLRAQRIADGGARLDPAGELALDAAVRFDGLFVDAPRGQLVLVGRRFEAFAGGGAPIPMRGICCGVGSSRLVLWTIAADPSAPRRLKAIELDGEPLATRVVDGRLWAVGRHVPRFDGFDRSGADALANQRWLDALQAPAGLPGWSVDGVSGGPLLAAGACLAQRSAPAPDTALTVVLAIDLADPAARPLARCVVSAVDTVHMTRDTLVLTTTRGSDPGAVAPAVTVTPVTGSSPITTAVVGEPGTDLHRFALRADAIEYRGSGSVPGTLGGSAADAARFAISTDGPWLRVLTQRERGAAPGGSPAQLTVLEDRGEGALRVAATLPNERRPEPIGKPGEQVHGVRFVGSRAYAVTFRRTDPLFVIDLADPRDPKRVGMLEVPGFADRLYPLGERLLLGVGHDTVEAGGVDLRVGVLVSLTDVGDPARPRELGRRVIGARGSLSAADVSPHGAMVRAVDGRWRIALPVAEHSGAASDAVALAQPAPWRAFSRLGAFRFVVDPAAPALVERATVLASSPATVGTAPFEERDPRAAPFDRALDLGDTTWLWHDGRFAGARW
jgi:hypothetical protein